MGEKSADRMFEFMDKYLVNGSDKSMRAMGPGAFGDPLHGQGSSFGAPQGNGPEGTMPGIASNAASVTPQNAGGRENSGQGKASPMNDGLLGGLLGGALGGALGGGLLSGALGGGNNNVFSGLLSGTGNAAGGLLGNTPGGQMLQSLLDGIQGKGGNDACGCGDEKAETAPENVASQGHQDAGTEEVPGQSGGENFEDVLDDFFNTARNSAGLDGDLGRPEQGSNTASDLIDEAMSDFGNDLREDLGLPPSGSNESLTAEDQAVSDAIDRELQEFEDDLRKDLNIAEDKNPIAVSQSPATAENAGEINELADQLFDNIREDVGMAPDTEETSLEKLRKLAVDERPEGLKHDGVDDWSRELLGEHTVTSFH
ncbi:hypothetical protein ABLN87_21210 [Ruegeria sp. SCPT10]|uniref:hypothetical protein n=1 Tax=Ruegeria sp. SCP10 TaxID=3141377 RepID=UPI003334CA48